MFPNSAILLSLYYQDSECAETYAGIVGGNVAAFRRNLDFYPPSYAVIRQGNDVLIVLAGTTNRPQWLSHIGGTIYPLLDPALDVKVIGSFKNAADIVGPEIIASLGGNLSGLNIRICGHSYGGGVGTILAGRFLLGANPPASVQIMTFGEPRVFVGENLPFSPTSYDRIVDAGDPVPYAPPRSLSTQLLRLNPLSAELRDSGGFNSFGSVWTLSGSGIRAGQLLGDYAFIDVDAVATIAGAGIVGHYMESGYAPYSYVFWQDSNGDPELSVLYRFLVNFNANANIYPPRIGPTVSPTVQGQAWYPGMGNPVTNQNQSGFQVVSSSATLARTESGSTMTQMKGTFIFQSSGAGFTESVYAVDQPSLTYAGMKQIMLALWPVRAKLSMTKSNKICENPLILDGIRVEDELEFKDAFVDNITSIANGYNNGGVNGSLAGDQNLSVNLSAKVQFRGPGAQNQAFQYIHCIPLVATDDDFDASPASYDFRNSPMSAQWIANLNDYCDALRAAGVGFRTMTSPQDLKGKPLPAAKVTAAVYDDASDLYTFTVGYAPPAGRFSAAYRGFKALKFVNGRWPSINAGANQITLQLPVRSQPFDNNGYISPIVWSYFKPNPSGQQSGFPWPGVDYRYIGPKKVGRLFFSQPGRSRKRVR